MSSTERMVGQAPLRLCVALIGVFAGDVEQQIQVHFKTFFKTLLADALAISGAVVRTGLIGVATLFVAKS